MTIQASLVLRDIFQFNTIWHGQSMATLLYEAGKKWHCCTLSVMCMDWIH